MENLDVNAIVESANGLVADIYKQISRIDECKMTIKKMGEAKLSLLFEACTY